jgi:cellulose biosynthesis protein BcsQ
MDHLSEIKDNSYKECLKNHEYVLHLDRSVSALRAYEVQEIGVEGLNLLMDLESESVVFGHNGIALWSDRLKNKLKSIDNKIVLIGPKKVSGFKLKYTELDISELYNMVHYERVYEVPRRGISVSVYANKGGVGKTTLSMAISHALTIIEDGRDWPRKILLVDFDSQMNLSSHVIENFGNNVRDLFESTKGFNQLDIMPGVGNNLCTILSHLMWKRHIDITPHEINEGLFVITGMPDLLTIEANLSQFISTGQPNQISIGIQSFINIITKEYDIVIYDLNPGKSWLNQFLLSKSYYVLMPTLADPFSRMSFLFIDDWIDKNNLSVKKLGFILNRVRLREGNLYENDAMQLKEHLAIAKCDYLGHIRDLGEDAVKSQSDQEQILDVMKRYTVRFKVRKLQGYTRELFKIAQHIKIKMIQDHLVNLEFMEVD